MFLSFLFLALLFFSKNKKSFLFLALLVSIDHSHSISRHRLRKLSKSSTCATLLRGCRLLFACDHWCPNIVRHRALLCVLLTHVWKPGLTMVVILFVEILYRSFKSFAKCYQQSIVFQKCYHSRTIRLDTRPFMGTG